MAKTPDLFIREPIEESISDNNLFIRLEYSSTRYYLDDCYKNLHRDSGPAVIYNNECIEYWRQGKLHNIFGPAIQTASGKKIYYLYGRRLTYEKWMEVKKKYFLDKIRLNSVINNHEDNGESKSRN